MITVASLKETQRDYTETDSSDEFTSSQSEPMFASAKFTKSRKRKFSDIWACSKAMPEMIASRRHLFQLVRRHQGLIPET
jgi:hypothetical protein